MLKLQSDGSFDAPAEFTPQSLQQHFRTAGVSGASNYSRVYILEGLHPDFVSVLGEHFGMHPSFFVDHERVVVNADVAAKEADTLVLPSLLKSRQHCLIITDPPLQVVRLAPDEKTNTVVPIALTHFQGGYLDFMPHEMQMRTQSGPPRTSMLDDICFYIRTYANLINTGTPEGILLFAKKIVASHYLQHAQFMRSIISTTQFHMSRKAAIRLEQFSGEFVEAQWSDGQALERRMCEYCEDLEGIML
ncbi:uncharacterized protein E0L32_002154 [Thyridium curvatum]|uniref:Uncharacterized protein n=1 Tax=Thyridium curvatum TaxID=1093900 RepID=A0A507ARN3_9PEZI|nr:uncharacterized protein E0L32_001979 [Thyridium curvatum]XP_030989262.1 uncharacterized protein E0L32_002154 [Thyridium curvatum]TPX07376.1 hypothetical protein E0L32_001979 [Thyridium curvatum]TPX07551.1 hypothetical protein E0L32_002154 [Thyridium curvatum]